MHTCRMYNTMHMTQHLCNRHSCCEHEQEWYTIWPWAHYILIYFTPQCIRFIFENVFSVQHNYYYCGRHFTFFTCDGISHSQGFEVHASSSSRFTMSSTANRTAPTWEHDSDSLWREHNIALISKLNKYKWAKAYCVAGSAVHIRHTTYC